MAIGPIERAQKLLDKGDKDGVVKILTPIVKGNKDDVDAWWLLARAFAKSEHALYAADQVLRLKPDHREARALRIRLAPSPVDEFPFPNMLPPAKTKAPRPPRRSTLPTLPLWARVAIVTVFVLIAVVAAGASAYFYAQQQRVTVAADQLDRAIIESGIVQNYQVLLSVRGASDVNPRTEIFCFVTTLVSIVNRLTVYHQQAYHVVTYNPDTDRWTLSSDDDSWRGDVCPSGGVFGR